jgi:phosphoribosylformimino-5-aminoimidazole carboxamide ribotide isomerase
MQIIPAIDIKDGICLRATGVDTDPLSQASDFVEHGAEYLHIVDINGAVENNPKNFSHIRHIIDLPEVKIEVSAGINTPEAIQKYFALKPRPWQIILSSRAIFNLPFIETSLNRFGKEHLTVALDYNEDVVAARGWKETSSLKLDDVLEKLNSLKVKRLIATDVTRDGSLAGIDLKKITSLRKKYSGELIMSGGILSLDEIFALEEASIDGVIIGKAFYEKKIDLKDAIELGKTV